AFEQVQVQERRGRGGHRDLVRAGRGLFGG
ncbi:MAG: hypothetical protein QOE25_1565, partial [Actinomycetota bacterium]|nr:hypothetical protein [Actinomycetota bacterium]